LQRWPGAGSLGSAYRWKERNLYSKGGESAAGFARRLDDSTDSPTRMIMLYCAALVVLVRYLPWETSFRVEPLRKGGELITLW
jgi:hypothetical protein